MTCYGRVFALCCSKIPLRHGCRWHDRVTDHVDVKMVQIIDVYYIGLLYISGPRSS